MSRRYNHSTAEKGWVAGLQNAYAKGVAAAEDAAFQERHCPYSRFEHRKSWLEGFRWRRSQAELAQ